METYCGERDEMSKRMPLYEVVGTCFMGDSPGMWDSWIKTYLFRRNTTIELRETFIHPECVNVYLNVNSLIGLISVTGLFHISDVWLSDSIEMLNIIISEQAKEHGFKVSGSLSFQRYVMYTKE